MNENKEPVNETKETVTSILWLVAICAAVVGLVFGALGALIDLDFIVSIAYIAGGIFGVCIVALIVIGLFSWVFSFNWKERPFLKISCLGIIFGVLSYIIYAISALELFYIIFEVCAVGVAIAVVIGILKKLFS